MPDAVNAPRITQCSLDIETSCLVDRRDLSLKFIPFGCDESQSHALLKKEVMEVTRSTENQMLKILREADQSTPAEGEK
jgi:hypothetical protein